MRELPTKSPLDQITYEDLYRRWEKGNWSAMEIDFTEDREQWHNTFSDIERKAALWNYSLFFHGEDSVADNLSPYIDAAPKEEQKYFLATQQVDEARHAVFFSRFFSEVIGAGDSIASGLAYTEPQLTWGFRKIFDRLEQMSDELRRDPSLPRLAAAVALYHIVIACANFGLERSRRSSSATWSSFAKVFRKPQVSSGRVASSEDAMSPSPTPTTSCMKRLKKTA